MAEITQRQGENEFLSVKIGSKFAPLGCNNQFTEKVSMEKETLNCQANGTKVQSSPGNESTDFDVSGTFIKYTSPDATNNWSADELKAAAKSRTSVTLIVTADLEDETVGPAYTGFIYDVTISRENGKPTKYQFSFSSNSESTYEIGS